MENIDLDTDETIIYKVSKSPRTGIEIFISLILGVILAIFQYNTIESLDIFLKLTLLIGFLIIFLDGVNSFFLELTLSNKRIFIKSIFSFGKIINIRVDELKNISVNKYFLDTLKRGNLILFRNNKYPIVTGSVINIDILSEKIRDLANK